MGGAEKIVEELQSPSPLLLRDFTLNYAKSIMKVYE